MTPAEFQEKYFLATGIEIATEIAEELLKDQNNPWLKKIMKMAEPTSWSQLSGVYRDGSMPTNHPSAPASAVLQGFKV